ncbi:ethylene-responsive transcription factor like [Capsicum chacoense]
MCSLFILFFLHIQAFLYFVIYRNCPFFPLKTLIMKSYKRISKNTCVRLYPIGVRKRKNGKFCAEIKHPLNKKMIWLGTFVTAEDASKNYESKKIEFEELVMAKRAKNGQISEKFDQESCVTYEFEEKSSMSVDENTNTSNGVEESDEELMMGTWVKISENQEVKYSHKLGVPVVDNYGFLLGEFSILDDLRIYM